MPRLPPERLDRHHGQKVQIDAFGLYAAVAQPKRAIVEAACERDRDSHRVNPVLGASPGEESVMRLSPDIRGVIPADLVESSCSGDCGIVARSAYDRLGGPRQRRMACVSSAHALQQREA